jgi:N-acetylneuraminic acid mutarotase
MWITVGVISPLLILVILMIAFRFPPSFFPPPVTETDQPRWTTRASMPTPRRGLALASIEERVYAIAGESSGGVTDRVERYDLESDTWEELPAKPTAVTDVVAAVIGGKIYVPGGKLASGAISSKNEVFDPLTNQWSQAAGIPEPLSAYALAAFEGKLYLFGGWNGTTYVQSSYEYDPEIDVWMRLPDIPTPRGYSSAVVSGGKIYVLGGTNDDLILDVNEAFTPHQTNNQSWEILDKMPQPRFKMGAASLADVVHIVGGVDQDNEALPSWQYLPMSGVWQEFETATGEPWLQLGATPVGTLLVAIGGDIRGQPSDKNMAYQAIYTMLLPLIRDE